MREFQGQRQLRRLTASRPVQIFLVLILILVGQSVIRLYGRERAIALEEQSLRRALASLAARRAELAAEVAALETDRGVEAAIRERFGVVKPGEKVINLVGAPATSAPTAVNPSWWQEVVGWFQ